MDRKKFILRLVVFCLTLLPACYQSDTIINRVDGEEAFLKAFREARLNGLGLSFPPTLSFGGNVPMYPRKEVNLPTMGVWQEQDQGRGIVVYRDGSHIRTDSTSNPLALAIRAARKGDVIALAGDLRGVVLGEKDGQKKDYAYWGNNGEVSIRDLTLVSLKPERPAVIGGVAVKGNIMDAGLDPSPGDGNSNVVGGGIQDLLFSNLRISNAHDDSRTPFLIAQYSKHGTIRLYDVMLESARPGAFQGHGMMWGLRWHGRVNTIDIRGLTCPRAQEHCFYADSPGYLNNDLSYSVLSGVRQTAPSGRTGIQIVNRKFPDRQGGPSGRGPIVIYNADLWTEVGEGASAITVAGHLGEVYVLDSAVRTEAGALVVYPDDNKGLHLTEDGYICPLVRVENLNVFATDSSQIRDQLAFSGVGRVEIESFNIRGVSPRASLEFRRNNNTDLMLENDRHGNDPYHLSNGEILFGFAGPISQYEGFVSGRKIRYGSGSGSLLSDAEIDELFPAQ